MFPEYLVFSIAESAWFNCISKMLALGKMLCSALFHQGLITLEQSFFRGFMFLKGIVSESTFMAIFLGPHPRESTRLYFTEESLGKYLSYISTEVFSLRVNLLGEYKFLNWAEFGKRPTAIFPNTILWKVLL